MEREDRSVMFRLVIAMGFLTVFFIWTTFYINAERRARAESAPQMVLHERIAVLGEERAQEYAAPLRPFLVVGWGNAMDLQVKNLNLERQLIEETFF